MFVEKLNEKQASNEGYCLREAVINHTFYCDLMIEFPTKWNSIKCAGFFYGIAYFRHRNMFTILGKCCFSIGSFGRGEVAKQNHMFLSLDGMLFNRFHSVTLDRLSLSLSLCWNFAFCSFLLAEYQLWW